MSYLLSAYHPPPLPASYLLREQPSTVPPTDDLVTLQSELERLKQAAVERRTKAENDIRTADESFKRMREREKEREKEREQEKNRQKAAVEKVKREPGTTPMPDEPGAIKSRPLGLGTGPPNYPRTLTDTRQMSVDEKKKKKKRKLDELDSEGEQSVSKRRASPALSQTHTPIPPPKPVKPIPPPAPFVPTPGVQDFRIPEPRNLLPLRGEPQPPPVAGPSKPTQVTADFSTTRQPPQTVITTFYTAIEPWLRPLRDEDLGFLEYAGDETDIYLVPKPGPHYTELWEREDQGYSMLLPMPPPSDKEKEAGKPKLPSWDPQSLTEADLVSRDKGMGPLTERVITAMLPSNELKLTVKAYEEAMEGRGPGGGGRERFTVADLEDRVKASMRFNGLLEDDPDFANSLDDPIATALRHAQAELRQVVATNKARKARLLEIAENHAAYQEYTSARLDLETAIANLYSKRQRRDKPRNEKKKKKDRDRDRDRHHDYGANGLANGKSNGGATNGGTMNGSAGGDKPDGPPPGPCPAAVGLEVDASLDLGIPSDLKKLLNARNAFVELCESALAERQTRPGRVWGLPQTSVYDGIEEEVEEMLRVGVVKTEERVDVPLGRAKGKERASMDTAIS